MTFLKELTKNGLLGLILIGAGLFGVIACSDDEAAPNPFIKTPGTGEFYRISAFGNVDVIPSKRQVRILARVTDSLHFGVPGLEKSDFEVLENNEDKVSDVEANTKIDPDSIPFTIKTVLLLDISKSLEGEINNIKTAVNNLIDAKVDQQEFAIYTFDSKVNMIQDFTSDAITLKNSVNALPESELDASTNLYRAIIDASKAWQDKITIDEIQEGSMIIFTDGKHNADPNLNLNAAIGAIKGKSVFVAALDGPNLDEANLKSIVGNEARYLLADDISKLEEVFLSIQQKIITQSKSIYYITYTSPISVSGTQNLKVLLKNNRNIGEDCMVEKTFSTSGF
ncbi:VWA domain-containing protein [Fulvivirgaceae bacterium BMA10]|uniref:VWA domain-containing protein n=1 Tax=Splendidivirga corallicola TaxID=3051826 RepID=A0ABT8KUP6_9BACT|nr:VWA domain-containing protein [Fulvivirgaceae bacterium BMA10]